MRGRTSRRSTSKHPTFSIHDSFYPSLQDILDPDLHFIKNNKGIAFANHPCAFDIEASSFYSGGEKQAVMYAFVLGINGRCILGRSWEEAISYFRQIASFYRLSKDRRMIFYIHNLSYEFQFMRKLFDWEKIFALDERDPVQAITKEGIEFRCSYHLSGYSLASVGKNLAKYRVEKMVGDLDYSLLRGPETPLTPKEEKYILHDGLVVMAYIKERMEESGDNITRIPLTKTGYVRKYVRKECLYGGAGSHAKGNHSGYRYRRIMKGLTLSGADEYLQLKRAFQGGFTHANALYSGLTMEDVTSYDFTSSYPYVMVAYQFPMSKGELVSPPKNLDELNERMKYYCCLFDVTFFDLEATRTSDHPISSSKCIMKGYRQVDNGRVVNCDELFTTITEQDYKVYRAFYKWSHMKISNFRIYKKAYLPTPFVKAILTLYRDKTQLKGLEDMDSKINYMRSKEQLNSCYGMTVTDICRDDIVYDGDEWGKKAPDVEKAIEKYNNSKSRFLFYPWGVWVTAYARRNLFTGIYECGDDYIYSDTDSIKILHAERHMEYIRKYNANVRRRLMAAAKYHKLDFELFEPTTKEGKKKLIGVWDYDGHYAKFKTLGAKRYMVESDDGSHSLTVSGIDKRLAIPYLEAEAKRKGISIFDLFDDGLIVPRDHSGRNIHTYLDDGMDGYAMDFKGRRFHYHEESAVHLEASEYTMGLSYDYMEYILGLREVRYA